MFLVLASIATPLPHKKAFHGWNGAERVINGCQLVPLGHYAKGHTIAIKNKKKSFILSSCPFQSAPLQSSTVATTGRSCKAPVQCCRVPRLKKKKQQKKCMHTHARAL